MTAHHAGRVLACLLVLATGDVTAYYRIAGFAGRAPQNHLFDVLVPVVSDPGSAGFSGAHVADPTMMITANGDGTNNAPGLVAPGQAQAVPHMGSGPGGPWDLSYLNDPAQQSLMQQRFQAIGQNPSAVLTGVESASAAGSPVSADIFGYNSPSADTNISNTIDYGSSEDRRLGCLKSCVDHGHCDPVSSQCICESFWMMNPFTKMRPRDYRPNCDWNIFVVIGVLIGITGGLILLAIILHCCCRRCYTRESKTRHYSLLNDRDLDGKRRLHIPRAPIMDSDDEDEPVYEAKNPKYYPASSSAYQATGETAALTKKSGLVP